MFLAAGRRRERITDSLTRLIPPTPLGIGGVGGISGEADLTVGGKFYPRYVTLIWPNLLMNRAETVTDRASAAGFLREQGAESARPCSGLTVGQFQMEYRQGFTSRRPLNGLPWPRWWSAENDVYSSPTGLLRRARPWATSGESKPEQGARPFFAIGAVIPKERPVHRSSNWKSPRP